MSKVLQIRRGTTAQNDAFTGMSGEITVDTEQHTIRVHDETTLGGFALARLDQITGFDIDSVPDAWWESKIPQFCPAPFSVLTDTVSCATACYIESLFNINVLPINVVVEMIANTDVAGYATGDSAFAFGAGDMPITAPNRFVDSDGLHVRLMTGGHDLWVANKTTGDKTTINNADWSIKFTIYY